MFQIERQTHRTPPLITTLCLRHKRVWTLVPTPPSMPSTASPLQPVQTQTAPRPQMRRSISLRANLQTDGPTPPSLLHSRLLNATTRGPAIYPTLSPAVSQPSSRRPSESACSVSSSSSRASSHCSVVSNASSTSAVSKFHPIPGTISPHVQRNRFIEPRPPCSIFHTHTSTHSWSSPTGPSAGQSGELDYDPWRILDTVPAPPHRGSPQTLTPSASTPPSVRVVATTAMQPGIRAQHTHVPHSPLSHHAQIGSYTPPEMSSHQQHSRTQMQRFGSGTTPLVSNGVVSHVIQDPDPTPVIRNRPHSPP